MKKITLSFGICLMLLFGVTGCGSNQTVPVEEDDTRQFVKQNYANFLEGSPARLIGCADGYSNNGVFGTTWSKNNMLFDEENGMSLLLDVATDSSQIKTDSGDPYISAEMRSVMDFQYGYFGTYMKPSNVSGTASTFFLYQDNPHDEIDIEFLGKDTTKVQFNYFTDGVGGNEHWYDLGFDASEEYHHYGFYWSNNEICWYVDFKPVYKVTGDNLPTHKSKLICNHWAGNTKDISIMGWIGKIKDEDCPSYSRYRDIEVADINGDPMTILPKMKEYDVCPSDNQLSAKPVSFKSSSAYHILDKTSTTSFDISYVKTDITKDYRAVKFSVEGISEMKWVQFKIKNLNEGATYPALCRLDVNSSIDSTTSTFTNGWKNGQLGNVKLNNNNLEAHYEISVGEEAVMTFRWYGANANELTMLFDCFGDCKTINGVGQRDGHLFVSDFKFGGVQDYVATDTSGYVDELYTENGEIPDPDSDQAVIPDEYNKLNLSPKSTDYYQVSETADGTKVDYNQPAGGYNQCGYYGSNIFNGSTDIILVVKNLSSSELVLQTKIESKVDGTKYYLIDSVEILSDSKTGYVKRWSSSSPGVPYLGIAAGRTCQFKFALNRTDPRSIAYVVNPGASSETQGSFLIKGLYAKA